MSTPQTRLLLHVGLSKTGTTTLQRALFANHPEISYLGKYVPSKAPKGCLSQDVYDFLNPLLWDFSRPLDVDTSRMILEQKIMPTVDPRRLMVASWEGMADHHVKNHTELMNRLKSVFGPYRLMITVRNPLLWILSLYLQHLQGNFIYQNRTRWMGKAPYIDLDEWLTRMVQTAGSLDAVFSYYRNIQVAVDLLGQENVGVFVFEELIEDPERYFGAVCAFMGIDVAKGLELTRQQHLHPRITQDQLEFLQRVNSSTWARLMLKFKGVRARRRLLKANAGDGAPARVSLPQHWEPKIADATRSGNRWLVENYHLSLERFNYPL